MKRIVALSIIVCFFGSADAKNESRRARHKAIVQSLACNAPPPFPILNPIDQLEYEKGLSPEERIWTRKAFTQLEQKLNPQANEFDYVSCSFAVDEKGVIHEPVFFSTMLEKVHQHKLSQMIYSTSPLEPFPALKQRHQQVIVGFAKNSVTSLRLCK